jgi:hypothetical protein
MWCFALHIVLVSVPPGGVALQPPRQTHPAISTLHMASFIQPITCKVKAIVP